LIPEKSKIGKGTRPQLPKRQSAAFSFQMLLLIESNLAGPPSGMDDQSKFPSPQPRLGPRGKKSETLSAIAHVKSLANWPKPTAKPGVFGWHRIGDFAPCSYSLLY
jgi:hypothetical protein